MLKKRIIPCLDIQNGRTVKGTNFENLRDAGDPVELAEKYAEEGADELVFLDITATQENRKTVIELVKRLARHINIPFTVGGGISQAEDAKKLLDAGADKISINSAAVKNPDLINVLAKEMGSQCVVVAVDSRMVNGLPTVHISGGKIPVELNVKNWVRECEKRGAGEILLTSMDRDGTKKGFDEELLREVSAALSIPVIASGGAGNAEHFADIFLKTEVSAALAAGIFHYGEMSIPLLKQYLRNLKIPVR